MTHLCAIGVKVRSSSENVAATRCHAPGVSVTSDRTTASRPEYSASFPSTVPKEREPAKSGLPTTAITVLPTIGLATRTQL
jgi:hypothetical protein